MTNVLAASCLVLAASLSLAGAAGGTVDLAVAGRANATPSIAADANRVVIAWGAAVPDGATNVFAAVSEDGGVTFGAPVRVNDVDGDARLNGEQPPRVAIRGRAITVVWTTKGPAGTQLKQSRSNDAGKTFGRSAIVANSDAAGNRGWQAIAADAAGAVDAMWLDHRELARNDSQVAAGHHEHGSSDRGSSDRGVRLQSDLASKPDGVAMAQRSKLYVGSLAGGTPPRAVTGGVCYCCKTALAIGADGSRYAAWRHVYPGNIRDIAFTMSRDGGRTFAAPSRVSEDKWVLEGCPDDGPAIAVDGRNRVHVAWPTLVTAEGRSEPTIALFYAISTDGRRFTPRQRIPTEGTPHHPQIALAPKGSLALAWDEVVAGRRRAVLGTAAIGASGPAAFTRRVVSGDEVGLYPVVASTTASTIVAWTSGTGGRSVIRVLVARSL